MDTTLAAYIRRIWHGEEKFIFIASNRQCKKCNAVHGYIVKESCFENSELMKQYGFQKYDGKVYRPHPHCDCEWFNTKSEEVKDLAEQERKQILEVARKEYSRQKDIHYPAADACGTQSDEMASAIINAVNPVFWNIKILKGSTMLLPARAIANTMRQQSQHHVVAVISKVDPGTGFILDPYYGDVSGDSPLATWISKYGVDPFFMEFSGASAEAIQKINRK